VSGPLSELWAGVGTTTARRWVIESEWLAVDLQVRLRNTV